jgi:hypothetical protein
MRVLILAAVCAAFALPACAQDSAKPMTVSKEAWQGFEDYKAWIGDIGSGYFAIAQDGHSAWAGSGCQVDGCYLAGVKEQIMADCQKNSDGVPCLIFARNHDPIVPYQRAP